MNRRSFIHLASATAAASGLFPGGGVAAEITDPWAQQFRAALAKQPWLLGYLGTHQETFQADAPWTGDSVAVAGLHGAFYRNGPAQHEVGNYRYRHWFDGDGMLQRWQLKPDGVSHRAAMIGTDKYLREKAAGRALVQTLGSVPPNHVAMTSPDAMNSANISVRFQGGRLMALWEAGSAWEMDPDTVATRGKVQFSPATAGVPFSAHPRIEPDGTLWNFGYQSAEERLVLWQVSPAGKLIKTGIVPVKPITLIHDFIVTSRHLVIPVAPLNFEPPNPGASFLDTHHWHGHDTTRVLVVNKSDFGIWRWFELPAQWVFHYGNGFESGTMLEYDGARADTPLMLYDGFRNVMRGDASGIRPNTRYYRYRLNLLSGAASEEPLLSAGTAAEFPTIDPRLSTQRHRQLVMLTTTPERTTTHRHLDAVSILDRDAGTIRRWSMPEERIPEEHVLVPKLGSAPGGEFWIVGTFLDWKAGRTGLQIFDSASLEDGPRATALLPYAMPLGLHGYFMPA